MDLRRWTPFTFVTPRRYADEDPFWSGFDMEAWASNRYEWVQDPWNGFRDFAKHPRDTVREEKGDCEDFALVAVSWAIANGRPNVGLALCWETPYPWPRHVIAYDTDRVYSSGYILEQSVDEWLAESKYAFSLRRQIT